VGVYRSICFGGYGFPMLHSAIPLTPSIPHLANCVFFFALLPCFPSSFRLSSVLVILLNNARPAQPQALVAEQTVDQAVSRGPDGGGQDDAEGDEFRGDRLQLAETLGDGVAWGVVLVCDARGLGGVRLTGLFFFLRHLLVEGHGVCMMCMAYRHRRAHRSSSLNVQVPGRLGADGVGNARAGQGLLAEHVARKESCRLHGV